MILPIFTVALFNFTKIELGIWIQIHISKSLNYFALDLEAFFSNIHLLGKKLEKFFFTLIFSHETKSWKIDCDNTDRTRQSIRTEKSSTSSIELLKIEAKTAAH